jgi:hypothetical protein
MRNLLGQEVTGGTFFADNVYCVKAVVGGLECRQSHGGQFCCGGVLWVPLDVISEKSEVTHTGEKGSLIVSLEYAKKAGWTK